MGGIVVNIDRVTDNDAGNLLECERRTPLGLVVLTFRNVRKGAPHKTGHQAARQGPENPLPMPRMEGMPAMV